MPREDLIQMRRGTEAEWLAENPVLAVGEFGWDLTNNALKIGDGTTAWTTLPYVNSVPFGPAGGALGGTFPDAIALQPAVVGDVNVDPDNPLGRDKLAPVEAKHLVGEAGEPAFGTGWSNLQGGYQRLAFWLDEASEIVYLEGVINSNGSAANPVFTLPVGYRPLENKLLPGTKFVVADTVFCAWSVLSNGQVTVEGGTISLVAATISAWFRLAS